MITRVLDSRGSVLHDCAEAGCEISWDGYAIRDVAAVTVGGTDLTATVETAAVAKGAAVVGRTDVDPKVWNVSGRTATRIGD